MRHVTPIFLFLLLSLAPAMADPRIDVLSAASRCNAIGDYRTWLDCYYGAAQPLRGLLGLSPAPAGQVKLVPPAPAGAVSGPVASYRPPAPLASAAPPRMATSRPNEDGYTPRQRMESYSFDGERRFTVTLEDGSVWRQTKEDSIKARWQAPAETYTASVVPGIFGSFLMRVSDKHSYRVSRAR